MADKISAKTNDTERGIINISFVLPNERGLDDKVLSNARIAIDEKTFEDPIIIKAEKDKGKEQYLKDKEDGQQLK